MLAVVDAETLVFPADEDCGDDVTGAIWDWLVEGSKREEGEKLGSIHEDYQAGVVGFVVVEIVETG